MGKQQNLITLVFIINGKEFQIDNVNLHEPLHVSATKALGQNSRPLSDYDVLYNNSPLDVNKKVEDLGLIDHAQIYLSLKGGKGGC